MMKTSHVVTGILDNDRTIMLDEPLAIPSLPVKVRLVVELLAPAPKLLHDEVIAEIRARQRARGHVPPTREEVGAYLQAERDSWDD